LAHCERNISDWLDPLMVSAAQHKNNTHIFDRLMRSVRTKLDARPDHQLLLLLRIFTE
jgi:hypothetical protein